MPILISQLVMKPVLFTMALMNGVLILGTGGYFLFVANGGAHLAAWVVSGGF